MVAATPRRARLARHPGEQCRHSVHRQRSRIFPTRMGRDHRDQPLGRLPRHEGGDPADEAQGLGPHHQYRLGARPGRERRRRRPMWPPSMASSGMTKVAAIELAECGVTVQRDLPRLGADAAGAAPARGSGPRGRHERRAGRCIACSPRSSRWPQFSTPEQIGALAVFLCSEGAKTITGAPLSSTAAGCPPSVRQARCWEKRGAEGSRVVAILATGWRVRRLPRRPPPCWRAGEPFSASTT